MTKGLIFGALACALMASSSAAFAGEITGNGKDITRHANSLCAFSGLNDTPDGLWLPIGPGGALVQVDPGGHTQSYGSFMSSGFLPSPSTPSGRDAQGGFPGASCNPNGGGGE
jgi:hypothetical protein